MSWFLVIILFTTRGVAMTTTDARTTSFETCEAMAKQARETIDLGKEYGVTIRAYCIGDGERK